MLPTNYGRVVDVAFSDDGTLYYGLTGMRPSENLPAKVFSARSDDLGRTFETIMPPGLEPNLADNNVGSHGEPAVRADPNNPARVYMAWQTNWGLWNLEASQLRSRGDRSYDRSAVGHSWRYPMTAAGRSESRSSSPVTPGTTSTRPT